ncbi:MAG: serine/threonine protein phosphatase, partial [Desulfobacca sp.]|nr:serine/threonine protein phosphatase [Desulfobacca sp.]
MKRILAVGDIHGCYAKLVGLMEKIRIHHKEDILVFLGDYVDRGDQSREVVEYLVQLKKLRPNTVFLLGNHEQMLLEYLKGEMIKPYLINGGHKTLSSYSGQKGPIDCLDPMTLFPGEHLEFFHSLIPWFEFQDYVFVHAGLRSGLPLERQELSDLLWIREDFYFSKYDFGKTIVFGHTPFPEPFVFNKKIGIDTGAVYGNKLTAVELP